MEFAFNNKSACERTFIERAVHEVEILNCLMRKSASNELFVLYLELAILLSAAVRKLDSKSFNRYSLR